MAYGKSPNLGFETASKLGHLSVIQDPFINALLDSFQRTNDKQTSAPSGSLTRMELGSVRPLDFVIAVDGSVSTIPNSLAPHKTLSYVKIGVLNISMEELQKAQAPIVNPETVQKILSEYADTESTVLPLSNIHVRGKGLFESVRHAIEATLNRFQGGQLYDTLRFLVSQEWEDEPVSWKSDSQYRPYFFCPFCETKVVFPRSKLEFACTACGEPLTLADYLGLLMEANDTSNDPNIATNLMGVLEHLTLIHFLRVLIHRGHRFHGRVLLLKDGPLMLRGQYSRLINPIRAYLRYLLDKGVEFYVAGIEKDGAFVDYIPEMDEWFREVGSVFVPDNKYILNYIKHSGGANTMYGEKVLYGSKVYYRVDARNVLVLNVPNHINSFFDYGANPSVDDLVGVQRIVATLSKLVSRQYQNAVVPIVAVNKIASMSFYPSNNVLERFTESRLGTST